MLNILQKTRYFLRKLKNIFFNSHSNLSYSQEGEDMILERIFANNPIGFYVDVGAHHPQRFSNTYKFYLKGWSGINIEPNPDLYRLFVNNRKRDVNLNIGVSTKIGTLKYYMFDEPALNTFDYSTAQSRLKNTSYNLLKEPEVLVSSLENIFNSHIQPTTVINYMTIDVEGLDLEVLQSNDWNLYRPEWVLVEQLNMNNLENLDFDIHYFMKSVRYILFAKTFNSLFYKREDVVL